jgi:hypothetical protein
VGGFKQAIKKKKELRSNHPAVVGKTGELTVLSQRFTFVVEETHPSLPWPEF